MNVAMPVGKVLRTVIRNSVPLMIVSLASFGLGQMIDNTQAPNTAKAGINKSLLDEIGPGRGDA